MSSSAQDFISSITTILLSSKSKKGKSLEEKHSLIALIKSRCEKVPQTKHTGLEIPSLASVLSGDAPSHVYHYLAQGNFSVFKHGEDWVGTLSRLSDKSGCKALKICKFAYIERAIAKQSYGADAPLERAKSRISDDMIQNVSLEVVKIIIGSAWYKPRATSPEDISAELSKLAVDIVSGTSLTTDQMQGYRDMNGGVKKDQGKIFSFSGIKAWVTAHLPDFMRKCTLNGRGNSMKALTSLVFRQFNFFLFEYVVNTPSEQNVAFIEKLRRSQEREDGTAQVARDEEDVNPPTSAASTSGSR